MIFRFEREYTKVHSSVSKPLLKGHCAVCESLLTANMQVQTTHKASPLKYRCTRNHGRIAKRFGGLRSKTLSPFTYARNATTYSPKRPPPTKEALMANIPVPFLYGIYPKSARTLYGVFGTSPHCVCLVSEIGFFAMLRNYRVALRCLLRGIGGSRRPIFRKAS